MAIAPVAIGAKAAPELQRALAEELPRALAAAGFVVKEPKEVDLKVAERPDLLRCSSGPCLVDEASLLQVQRLVVPQLQPDATGTVTLRLQLFDAFEQKVVIEASEPCAGCSDEKLRALVIRCAAQLRAPVTATVTPPRTMPPPTAHAKPRFRVVKWIALAAGLAAAGAGAGLWAIDGDGTCSLMGMQRQCPKVYDTLPAGAALVGVGGALVLSSIVMIGLDARHDVAVSLAPSTNGGALVAGGRF